jgi:hypothetical protein
MTSLRIHCSLRLLYAEFAYLAKNLCRDNRFSGLSLYFFKQGPCKDVDDPILSLN